MAHAFVNAPALFRRGRFRRRATAYDSELSRHDAYASPVAQLGDIGDLAGTGIPAIDNVLADFNAKAKKVELALTIITPASCLAAACGLLLLLGYGGRRS